MQTLLPGVIPANHSAASVQAKGQKTRAICGRKCFALLSKSDPLGLLPKMLSGTLQTASTSFAMTWKVKATPSGRLLFQLAPLDRPNKESGYGWWRTLRASESAEPWKQVDARRSRMRSEGDVQTGNLYGLTQELQKAEGLDTGRVNPEWAEWFQGYPPGWTKTE